MEVEHKTTQCERSLSAADDVYIRSGALFSWRALSVVGPCLEWGKTTSARLNNVISPTDTYQFHLTGAKAKMIFGALSSQYFIASLRGFFAVSTSDEERESHLNALDQVALGNLLEELDSFAALSLRDRRQNNELTFCLLKALIPGDGPLIYYKKELNKIILRMHEDRATPLNRDFGCAFRNDARDLLWKLVLFLKERCNGQLLDLERAQESPTGTSPRTMERRHQP